MRSDADAVEYNLHMMPKTPATANWNEDAIKFLYPFHEYLIEQEALARGDDPKKRRKRSHVGTQSKFWGPGYWLV